MRESLKYPENWRGWMNMSVRDGEDWDEKRGLGTTSLE
jgi:hypothetical protein